MSKYFQSLPVVPTSKTLEGIVFCPLIGHHSITCHSEADSSLAKILETNFEAEEREFDL